MDDSKSNVEQLLAMCLDNVDYFTGDSSANGRQLFNAFQKILITLEELQAKCERIRAHVAEYDYDEHTPGNGYRSFIIVAELTIANLSKLVRKVHHKRSSHFFWKTSYARDVEAHANLLESLGGCFVHLEKMLVGCKNGNLIPDADFDYMELLERYHEINQAAFYGRTLGQQFCASLRSVMQFLAITMTIFSEYYYSEGDSFISKATSSVMASSKYLHDADERAKRIVTLSERAEVDFCKAFWFLAESEFLCALPTFVSPNMAVTRTITLPTDDIHIDGVRIPVPSAHIGKLPVQVRLISYEYHEHMIGADESRSATLLSPAADGLLFHCHGGGFVAQSSLSHECYLREWAKELRMPIVSVDYSLAPEAPFPRALEEILYAFCWCRENRQILGVKPDCPIVAAGDSAGGNLIVCMSLKCIDLGIPTPHGLFMAYTPTIIHVRPSPSRLLCLMDPLLPFGFLMRCIKAYNETKVERSDSGSECGESFEQVSKSDLAELEAQGSSQKFGPGASTEPSVDTLSFDSVHMSDVSITENLDKYVLDENLLSPASNNNKQNDYYDASSSSLAHMSRERITEPFNSPSRIASFVSSVRWHLSSWIPGAANNQNKPSLNRYGRRTRLLNAECSHNSIVEVFQSELEHDYFKSPWFALDETLKQLPPTRVLSVHLDPLLDDNVMFAKRLRDLQHDVTLDILDGLPHGFLNFALFSKDAFDGSKLCLTRIRGLFEMYGVNFADI